jgi:hypothetical protein
MAVSDFDGDVHCLTCCMKYDCISDGLEQYAMTFCLECIQNLFKENAEHKLMWQLEKILGKNLDDCVCDNCYISSKMECTVCVELNLCYKCYKETEAKKDGKCECTECYLQLQKSQKTEGWYTDVENGQLILKYGIRPAQMFHDRMIVPPRNELSPEAKEIISKRFVTPGIGCGEGLHYISPRMVDQIAGVCLRCETNVIACGKGHFYNYPWCKCFDCLDQYIHNDLEPLPTRFLGEAPARLEKSTCTEIVSMQWNKD